MPRFFDVRRSPDSTGRGGPSRERSLGGVVRGVIVAIAGAVAVKWARPPCADDATRGWPPTVDEQLADAVRSFAAGMRAGLSFTQAIAFASRRASRRSRPRLAPWWTA